MKRSKWFYLSICLIAIILIQGAALLGFFGGRSVTADAVSLEENYDSFDVGGIHPEAGYIADAKTAAVIGGTIIDQLCKDEGKTVLPWERGRFVAVEYDSNLRLWQISKGYLMHRGAVIIIEQDTGAVINAWFRK